VAGGGQPTPVVVDFQGKLAIDLERDSAGTCPSVTHHVGQRILQDALGGDLDRCRQRRQALRGVHENREVRPGDPGDLFLERPDQPQGIQSRRTQRVNQATNVVQRAVYLGDKIRKQGHALVSCRWELIASGFGLQGDGGQHWPQPVVQVATQAPSFLFAGRHQVLARALERTGQVRRVDCHTSLVRNGL